MPARSLFAILQPCLLLLAATSGLLAAEPQPGEWLIDAGGQLLGTQHVPTIAQLEAAVAKSSPEVVATVRLHSDDNNHYAPAWSSSAAAVAMLRGDLELGTRKAMAKDLRATPPNAHVFLADQVSFEDSVAWSRRGTQLLFASNFGIGRGQRIFASSVAGPPTPISGVAGRHTDLSLRDDLDNQPLISVAGNQIARWNPANAVDADPVPDDLGAGEAIDVSPDGNLAVIVRSSAEGHSRLMLRDLSGSREKLLFEADRLFRKATFSPDGRLIAFHHRAAASRRWRLAVLPIGGAARPLSVAEPIRRIEGFDHIGPSWSPHSTGLWFFADAQDQAHYQLMFFSLRSRSSVPVAIDAAITSAAMPAAAPQPDRPVVAFGGHTGLPRDIFAAVLSQTP